MSGTIPTRRVKRPSEEGYLLVAVIFMLALLILSLSVALPKIRESIQRDREVETMHRGKQYIRAIQLYYRKFGRYPPNIDALVKTNDIRFLRKRYIDPMTGKDDWKPILFGQNKTPTAMGFFGQPLGGTTVAGTGPSGGNTAGNNTTTGSGSTWSQGSFSLSGSSGATGTTGTAGGTDSGDGTGTDAGTGLNGQTFGGAGIIGFSPASPKQSILVYKKKNHYNEWEFTYDPLQDQKTISSNTGTIGTPAGTSPTTTPEPQPTPTPEPPEQ